MAQEFRTGFDELARQAELDELKKEVDALRRTTSLQEIERELSKPLPTLEDYAGIKSQPAIPAPAVTSAPSSTSEAPAESIAADVTPEHAPAEEITDSAAVPEHVDVAPIARSAQ
jgi:sec-independent protein translocase protein TatB